MKRTTPRNSHIDPALYHIFLRLKDTLGAKIVHRRRRSSSTCIEIIFCNTLTKYLVGRINTLPEAEKCGFWIMCRPQTKREHAFYHGWMVFQLFLTPVHPKKRREQQPQTISNDIQQPQTIAADVSFEPIFTKKRVRACVIQKKVVSLHPNCVLSRSDAGKDAKNSSLDRRYLGMFDGAGSGV